MSHPSFNSTSAPNLPALGPDGSTVLPAAPNGWPNGHLRALVLAERRSVKLERAALLRILAQRDTPEQVVADLVAMFTETSE
jgi:hypothetical protein